MLHGDLLRFRKCPLTLDVSNLSDSVCGVAHRLQRLHVGAGVGEHGLLLRRTRTRQKGGLCARHQKDSCDPQLKKKKVTHVSDERPTCGDNTGISVRFSLEHAPSFKYRHVIEWGFILSRPSYTRSPLHSKHSSGFSGCVKATPGCHCETLALAALMGKRAREF